jgi:hypothetical protein
MMLMIMMMMMVEMFEKRVAEKQEPLEVGN